MSRHLQLIKTGLVSSACLLMTQAALAAVSAEEAKQLGATLTEFGAEKAGNADGSIPAYTGGLTTPPASWKKGTSQHYEDPYKGEKPLYVIDGKSLDRHAGVLTEGTKAMLKQYPSYRLDVYPTHRATAYAGWVLQNTVKNATTAKLSGEVEGDAVSGADAGQPFPGIPFPIPKNGYEVMWNSKMAYGPAVWSAGNSAALVDASGTVSALPSVTQFHVRPWYDRSGKLRKEAFNATFGFSTTLVSPPSSAGVHFLNYYLADSSEGGQKVWFYTPGQRRVRAAPEFNYDIPIASYGGVLVWDEIFGFVGRMDRFNFKLVGKKEMVVPSNVYGITNTIPSKDALGAKHVNPEAVRWEKRRVWVVDAVRKPDARHAYSRRTFYIDEDSWMIVSTESYDATGKLWRTANIYTYPTYDVGGNNNACWAFNDLLKGNYFVINMGGADPGNYVRSYDSAEGLSVKLTPQSVAAGSVR